jgi:hypothetical protein
VLDPPIADLAALTWHIPENRKNQRNESTLRTNLRLPQLSYLKLCAKEAQK